MDDVYSRLAVGCCCGLKLPGVARLMVTGSVVCCIRLVPWVFIMRMSSKLSARIRFFAEIYKLCSRCAFFWHCDICQDKPTHASGCKISYPCTLICIYSNCQPTPSRFNGESLWPPGWPVVSEEKIQYTVTRLFCKYLFCCWWMSTMWKAVLVREMWSHQYTHKNIYTADNATSSTTLPLLKPMMHIATYHVQAAGWGNL